MRVLGTFCRRDRGYPVARGPAGGVRRGRAAAATSGNRRLGSALRLPDAEDHAPAPDVVEVHLEAKVTEIEVVPGLTTRVWTYNGMLPGPTDPREAGDRVVVKFARTTCPRRRPSTGMVCACRRRWMGRCTCRSPSSRARASSTPSPCRTRALSVITRTLLERPGRRGSLRRVRRRGCSGGGATRRRAAARDRATSASRKTAPSPPPTRADGSAITSGARDRGSWSTGRSCRRSRRGRAFRSAGGWSTPRAAAISASPCRASRS